MSGIFFQRFRWSDSEALAREIVEAETALAGARVANKPVFEIECACRLGNALIAADREAKAAALLTDALSEARELNDPALTAWVLNYLALARQYLGKRDEAQSLFREALDISTAHGLRDVEHYLWHHRGRCFAEQGDVPAARHSFEQALAIRVQIGEPRAERTRQAIAALESL